MRPERLELEGFSTFRSRTEVDFTGVELFALVGPTGSGKSSVVDAMVFALYGSVPRYGARLVHPVIHQGSSEARVRFDFALGDHRYSAVRVVRRTKTGASTHEARLERRDPAGGDPAVLAGDARELNEAIEALLGLTFTQFCTCVVLPQGEFARFLHDTRADRQDLLVRLLDLGLYERMAQEARRLERSARDRSGVLGERATALADATPEAAAAAAERAAVLDVLVRQLDEVLPLLAEAEAARAAVVEAARGAERRLAALRGVGVPDEVDALAARLDEARRALTQASDREHEARAEVEAAEVQRRSLPAEADLVAIAERRRRRAELDERIAKGERLLTEARADAADAVAELDRATRARDAAQAALDAARTADAAAGMLVGVAEGDPCPVCQRPLDALPEHDAGHVEQAAAALRAAASEHAQASDAAAAARATVERYGEALRDRRAEADELDAALAGAPGADELEALVEAIRAADARLDEAREGAKSATHAEKEARRSLDGLVQEEQASRRLLGEVRDALAPYGPPPVEGRDLAADWADLAGWASGELPTAEARNAELATEAERAASTVEEHRGALDDACAAAGVAVHGGLHRDAAVQALADARAERVRVDERVAEATELAAERARLDDDAALHNLLHRLLGSGGFEQWLLDEAVAVLLDGAGVWLRRLSGDRYSLAIDDRGEFCVVDHLDADSRRLARSLSGGETFLASLALALALAGQLAELAPEGAPRLDAMFLDEGFGTLDPDTLEAVAAAIEELGASGSVIGVVTHVRELAERVPVRFELRRDEGGATVERVVA